jgi:RNA polymerase sigma-70 factor (ECF subfamily)
MSAAFADDEAAYRRLVEPHRRELQAHCYRMLGSAADAEDALQEALLRAWRALPHFEGRSTPRSWLYRIATNTCLDAIARRPRRVLPTAGAPVTETAWLEPFPDELLGVEDGYAAPEARYEQRESVELAFIAALQHLPALQRAVLILREVLGFSAAEVADTLDTTTAAVNSAMQRARATVEAKLPERSQQATLRALGDEQVAELVERYVDAWDRGDVDAVVEMLAADAAFSMPPNVEWFRGRPAIQDFLPRGPLSIPRRFVPLRSNGQLGFATYRLAEEGWVPNSIHVITLQGNEIADATAFLMPGLFPRFSLPQTPPPRAGHRA